MQPTTYTFNRDGVPETVELERWAWGVVYKDGTEFHQFDAQGQFHQFKEVIQSEVAMFVMHQPASSQRIDTILNGDVQLFHFYRHIMLEQGTTNERKYKVYVFGWKEVSGATTYNYIFPDDHVLTSNHDIVNLTPYLN